MIDCIKRRLVIVSLSLVMVTAVAGQSGSVQWNDSDRLRGVDRSRFHFAVLGDRTGSGPDSWKIMMSAVREINRLSPDFTVMVGDVIEGDDIGPEAIVSRWAEARKVLDSLDVPFFLVPGNNDIWNPESYAAWKKINGPTYSSFTHRDCSFILLNSEEERSHGEAGFGAQQVRFAISEIEKHDPARPLFVFMHQPAWMLSGSIREQWETIASHLKGHNATVFGGHLHILAVDGSGETRYVLAGPTGGQLRLAYNPDMAIFHNYAWVTVDGSDAALSFIEPGHIRSEEMARRAYSRYQMILKLIEKDPRALQLLKSP